MGAVLYSGCSGVLKILEVFLGILWHGDVQYAGLVVPVWFNATVETPYQILCYLIFFCSAFMRCWEYSFIWYLMPNSSDTRINMIPLLLCCHSPGVMVAGS